MRYRPIIRHSALLMTVVLLASSCTSTGDTREVSSDRPIYFTASVSGTQTPWSITRSAEEYNNSFPENSVIDVFIYDDSNNDISVSQLGSSQTWVYKTVGDADAGTGKSLLTQTSPSDLPKFPSGCNYVNIFATFPHNGSVTPSQSSWTFSVSTNQTTNVETNDLLASEIASTGREFASAVNLDMKHRMAKVLVVFNPTGELSAVNMPNGSFSVTNVKTSVTISPKTGSVSTSGSTTTITAQAGQAFFLPPQTIAAGTQFLKFNLRNNAGAAGIQNVTVKPGTTLELNGGVFYVLTVDVGIVNVSMSSTITPWDKEILPFDAVIL